MNVSNTVIYGLLTPKMFVNFHKSHILKLLYPGKGKPDYICLRNGMSFKK